jgi:hypothetical protein
VCRDRGRQLTRPAAARPEERHPSARSGIFAADKAFWTPFSRRIQSTKPASDGHFRVANLPAGDYRIAVVTDVEQGEWYNPGFLTEIESASRPFTLADGEKKVEDFKIAGGSSPLTKPPGAANWSQSRPSDVGSW